MTERATQFGAFRALIGYEDELAETARCTYEKIEFDEYAKAEINTKLLYINDYIDERQEVTVTYFVPKDNNRGNL